MKVFSLFSGIGGFDLAMRNLGHEIVGACEIDKYARSVYSRHFPNVPIWEDATTIKPEELPDFDILCGGFPCQAFSLAGRRLGFEDTRGTLFYEIARIAKQKRPSLLFLENVRGLLYHDEGRTLTTIIQVFYELGYDIEWQVINSKYFVPQNRERIFIVGHLGDKPTPKIFPITEVSGICDKEQETTNVRTLTGGGHSGGLHSQMTLIYLSQKNMNMKQRVQDRDETWTLTGNGNDFGIIQKIKSDSQGARVYDVKGIGPCLGSGHAQSQPLIESDKVRRLTPIECERLQGFPDDWTDGISDTQRYKCLGNAVTVPVIEFIAKRFCI